MSSVPELDRLVQDMYEPVRRAAREAAVQLAAMGTVLTAQQQITDEERGE